MYTSERAGREIGSSEFTPGADARPSGGAARLVIQVLCRGRLLSDRLVAMFDEAGFTALAESDPYAFLEAAERRAPDLVLLDSQQAAFVLDEMRKNPWLRGVPAIVVWAGADLDEVVTALKLGATDAVMAPVDAEALLGKVRRLLKGRTPAPPEGWRRLIPLGLSVLTPREREILQFVIDGYATKEVGRKLGISPRTVEVHRSRIMAKFRARNVADLMRIALTG